MASFIAESGGNPGRSGHRLSLAAGRVVYQAREELADFFGLDDPLRLVFTANVTEAINLALYGLLRSGDHVIASSMEHNAVMRPLRHLQREGVHLSFAPCGMDGHVSLAHVEKLLKTQTRLVVVNHASNVTGTIQPIAEIGALCREHNTLFLVDAAQTAGVLPINIEELQIDLLAFTGHKGLLGPTGTGGLLLGERVPFEEMKLLVRGGTGSRSEYEEQPEFLPDRFESGTPNSIGLAGLLAGLQFIKSHALDALREQETSQLARLIIGLSNLPNVRLFGPRDPSRQVPVVSFTLDGMRVSDIGFRLDEEYGILCRPGLQCSPAAHRTLGTFPHGTVRLSPGPFTKDREIESVLEAVERLSAELL